MVLEKSPLRQFTVSRLGVHDQAAAARRMSARIIRFWLLAVRASAVLWGDAGCRLRLGER